MTGSTAATHLNTEKPKTNWKIFIVTGIADLVAAFAINSMNLALPFISKEFHVAQSTVSWLTLVYSLIPCCTLLLFGRVGDLFGYKKQFIAGFSVFGVVSALIPLLGGGIAPLIIFRCLQAVGYSLLMSITQATVKRCFDDSECGKAIGINSIFVSIGLATGPTIGGILLKYFSWHAIFYFNIPFCIAGIIATICIMESDSMESRNKKPLDIIGTVQFAIAICAFVIGINFSNVWGWISFKFALCMITCAVMLLLFVKTEQRLVSPLISMEYFKIKSFSLANIVCVISYFLQQMTTYLIPFFLISILTLPSDISGIIMLASPIPMMFFSPIGGKYADKKGTRASATVGLLFITAACVIMAMLRPAYGAIPVIVALICIGIGNGYSVSAINASILCSVPKHAVGTASGTIATMRNLGQSLGVAVSTAIIAMREPVYLAAGAPGRYAYVNAQRDAFIAAIALTIVAIILVRMLPNKRALQP